MGDTHDTPNPNAADRRNQGRYPVERKVYFSLIYDVRTRVKFQVRDKEDKGKILWERFPAVSKDVSAEGMRITCNKGLNKGDLIHLEVFLPHRPNPLNMDGEVRWSQRLPDSSRDRFDTGIKLLNIDGKSVVSSVYHDGVNQIVWSSVLESVFGDFKKITQKRYA